MASPQVEHGYTPIANELLEKIIAYGLSGKGLATWFYLARQIYGWKGRRNVRVTHADIAVAVNTDRKNAGKILKKLVDKNLAVQIDGKDGPSYRIQKNYSEWSLPYKYTACRTNTRQGAVQIHGKPPKSCRTNTRHPYIGIKSNYSKSNLKQSLAQKNGNLFDQFWRAYPKKKSKGDAFKAWKTLKPDRQLLDKMIKAIEQARASPQWTKDAGQFIPYPATWLRAQGWEDEMEDLKNGPKSQRVYDEPLSPMEEEARRKKILDLIDREW